MSEENILLELKNAINGLAENKGLDAPFTAEGAVNDRGAENFEEIFTIHSHEDLNLLNRHIGSSMQNIEEEAGFKIQEVMTGLWIELNADNPEITADSYLAETDANTKLKMLEGSPIARGITGNMLRIEQNILVQESIELEKLGIAERLSGNQEVLTGILSGLNLSTLQGMQETLTPADTTGPELPPTLPFSEEELQRLQNSPNWSRG
jgi:hypothetical protein